MIDPLAALGLFAAACALAIWFVNRYATPAQAPEAPPQPAVRYRRRITEEWVEVRDTPTQAQQWPLLPPTRYYEIEEAKR